jgi:hypothetical protein
MFGTGNVRQNVVSDYKFRENWRGESHTVLVGGCEQRYIYSLFINDAIWVQFIVTDLHVMLCIS